MTAPVLAAGLGPMTAPALAPVAGLGPMTAPVLAAGLGPMTAPALALGVARAVALASRCWVMKIASLEETDARFPD